MCPLKRVKSRQRLRFSMRHQRFIPSPSQLPPASFSADFSAVAHDRSLLNSSRTAWFDACLCRPTSRGLPSSSSVAPKNRSFSPSFTSHLHIILDKRPARKLQGSSASLNKYWSYKTLTTLLQEAQFHSFRFTGAERLPWLWKSMVISCRRAL